MVVLDEHAGSVFVSFSLCHPFPSDLFVDSRFSTSIEIFCDKRRYLSGFAVSSSVLFRQLSLSLSWRVVQHGGYLWHCGKNIMLCIVPMRMILTGYVGALLQLAPKLVVKESVATLPVPSTSYFLTSSLHRQQEWQLSKLPQCIHESPSFNFPVLYLSNFSNAFLTRW